MSSRPRAAWARIRAGAGVAQSLPFRRSLLARRSTLRWKIAATVTAVSCAAATVLGVIVHNVVGRHAVGEVRRDAATALDTALAKYAYGGSLSNTRIVLDPPALPAELKELVRDGQRGTMPGTHKGEPAMWAAAKADDHIVAVSTPYDDTLSYLAHLDTAILGSALLAAGTVTLAGIFLAGRISRRLDATAEVARRISGGDLDARVGMTTPHGPHNSGDEVLAVATALDSMASSLQDRIQSEKRFTADVAHELRTPLTGCLAASGLLPDGRPKEMITDRLKALHHLTEDLLEISRLDAGNDQPDLAPHALGSLVERALRSTGLEAHVNIAADTVVQTDRRRLDRVLTNLLVNAHRHGRSPLVVTVNGPVVEVRDHGPGYPAELLDHGPQRFRTSAPERGKGHGLGLTIATGQARALGIDLTFANAPETGGAIATLRLA
ncbi:sensor histidine kinase [Streptomyces sp. NPDC058525]|uniref:sensor histidine kinase n=1 Tax=Streptomyces sp. NPDC058525 TaxID=3346538 RepID=UPI00365DE109